MLDLWWAAPLTDEPAKNVLLSLNPNADVIYIYSKRSYLEVACHNMGGTFLSVVGGQRGREKIRKIYS